MSVRPTPPPVGAADVSASRTRLHQVLTVGFAHLELGEETGARLKKNKKKAPARKTAPATGRVKKPHRYKPGDQPELIPIGLYGPKGRDLDPRETPEMARLIERAWKLRRLKRGFGGEIPTDEEFKARMDAWREAADLWDKPPYGKGTWMYAKRKIQEFQNEINAEAARNGEPPYKYEYDYLVAQLEGMPVYEDPVKKYLQSQQRA